MPDRLAAQLHLYFNFTLPGSACRGSVVLPDFELWRTLVLMSKTQHIWPLATLMLICLLTPIHTFVLIITV